LRFGILFELLVQLWALVPQELVYCVPGLGMFPGRLERLEDGKILLAGLLQRWDGQLRELVLVGIGDTALGFVVVIGGRHGALAGLEGWAGGRFREGGEVGY
jgi:hypothetical protein